MLAQSLGLNTCWVAMTFTKIKDAFVVNNGEKLTDVISIGYGETQGVPHKSKSVDKVITANEETPDWFIKGVECALLAPTAINQQKFNFEYKEGKVIATAGSGLCVKTDLGIVKYHFELAVGKSNFF